MNEKIVIALGGNALQSGNAAATAEAQLEVVKMTAEYKFQGLRNSSGSRQWATGGKNIAGI